MTDLGWLKISIVFGVVALFTLAAILWSHTPELFEYFNMAFCAH
ncbi:hypothetical protein ACFODO_05445 [Acinetobacter sichuanensis]|uniref:Signal pepetide n=1 Tax=Acinetobacter sichuanensis TaxID=2136183 RepID=A0ABV7BBN3_9GAMM|nr:hypothetical protein [Acinetobacter sichuanensis]